MYEASSHEGRSQATPLWGVVLAGGKGTRLKDLYPGLPKPMVPCLGVPFLGWVLAFLRAQGIEQSVVSLGHLAHVATDWLDEHAGDSVRTVVEDAPLGTGGAIHLAWEQVPAQDASILATNGDSLVLADLGGAIGALHRPDIDGVIVGVEVPDTARFGSLDVSHDGLLRGFREKVPGQGLINAGIYLLKPSLRGDMGPIGSVQSMEKDLFPAMLAHGRRIHVHAVRAPFIDIGTPESVAQAEAFLREHKAAFSFNSPGPRPVTHGGHA